MWYGALLSLLLLFAVPVFFPPSWDWLHRIELTLLIVCFAVFAQAVGLLMVVSAANSPDRLLRYRRNYGLGLAMAAILAGGYLFGVLVKSSIFPADQIWWQRQWPVREFWLLVVAVFAAWAALGAYRVMRAQMQFRNGRLPWLLFNLFLMIFIAGFFFVPGVAINWHIALWVAFGVGLSLAYTLLITQPISQANISRLVAACRARDWLDVWQTVPLWIVSLVLAGLLSIVDILVPRSQGSSTVPEYLLLELLLFALRDSGVFILFLIGIKPGRAILTGFFYLILLYSVLPMLIVQMGWSNLLGLFWPMSNGQVTLLPIFLELVVLAVLIYRRWRGYLGKSLVVTQ